MDSVPTILSGTYDLRLVAASVAVAVLAGAAALDLAGRVAWAQDAARLCWLAAGAVAMGFGIWSMHYIGMLAFQLPVAVRYDWPTVLWSLLAAIAAAWVALFVVSRETLTLRQAVVGAVFMGGGIAAMHYIGMDAMRLPAMCRYSPELVKLSLLLAVVIAFAALQMTYAFRASGGWSWYKAGAAVTLGAALPIMHYVGMAAVTFVKVPPATVDVSHAIGISDLGILSIAASTLIVLGLVFLTSSADRRFSRQSQALESSEQRCRLILGTARDAFLEVNPDGLLTDWNARAEDTFGWQRFEAIGKPIETLISFDRDCEDTRRLREIFRTTEPGRQAQRLEDFARHRDGREFPVELTVAAVWLGDRFIYAAFVHDITARKLAAGERETARMAAEAGNRAKAEFLANISYALRTPMTGVIGMSELLLQTQLDPLQRDHAENIRDNANALLNVINDILDFSTVAAGDLELEMAEVDLRDGFADVARLISLQAHAKGLELSAQIDPLLPPLVRADAGRVRQILLKLGSNAVKFTRQGEVALEIKVLESGPRGTQVRCEVRDSGAGIPAERLTSLFTPFTQADPVAAHSMGGVGLGLSMVRRLVELMEGETGVESTVGVGSKFWFTACFGPVAAPASAVTNPQAVLNGQRILLVDDNATHRKVLMAQLLQCGVDPVSAGSAAEALMLIRHAAAAGRAFDAALLDHPMPGCDGAELGRIIAQDKLLESTRLILLSASGQRGDGQMFAELGFAGYLLKPVSQRDLTDCLMLTLGSQAETWRTHNRPMITRHALRAQRPR